MKDKCYRREYKCYRRDRAGGYGGVIVITKADLIIEEIVKARNCEFLAVKIQTHSSPLIIATAYRSPNNDLKQAEHIAREIIDLQRKHKNNPIWFGGDMNLLDIEWTMNSIKTHQYHKELNQCFLDTFDITNLDQIVDFPTRGANILEIMATNRPSLINKCSPHTGLSDHETSVLLNMNCHPNKSKPVKRMIYLWDRADLTLIKQKVETDVSNLLTNNTMNTNIDLLWSSIKHTFDSAMELVPSKFTSSRYSQPWVTVTCKRLSRRKKRAYNPAKRTQLKDDWGIFH